MSPTAECAAQSIEISLNATSTLPAGKMSLLVALAVEGRHEVLLAHVSVPDRGDIAEASAEYDGGRVIVDYDPQGRVMGVEINTPKMTPANLPEFSAVLSGRSQNAQFLRAAVLTAQFHWARMAFYFHLHAAVGAQRAMQRLRVADGQHRAQQRAMLLRLQGAARKEPELVRWQSPPRVGSGFITR